MGAKRDDFAWILDVLHEARRDSPGRAPRGAGYETPEQIYERRVTKRKKWRNILVLLLQIAIPFIIFLLLL